MGIFTRVAKQVGCSLPHVLGVARGERQSGKVFNAIVAEVQRVEREAMASL